MKKGWTTTKLMAAGSLGVLSVILQLAASGITATTGVAMASGVITSFTVPMLLVLCLQVVDRPGAGLVFMTVTGILNLPLAIAGPPGFLSKVFVQMGMGLIADLIFAAFKKHSTLIPSLIIGGVDVVYITFTVIAVGQLLNVPGIGEITTFVPLPIFIVVTFLMGAIGGYLGWLIYRKIKNTAVVKRIQQ